jgi:hypothetical protein
VAAVVELAGVGDLPAAAAAEGEQRLLARRVVLAQAADGRHPVGRRERLEDDLPDPHRVGDAAVAPVPAVAEDLGLGDEEERHRLDEGLVDALAELEVDRVVEEDAVLVAADVERGQLGVGGTSAAGRGERADAENREARARRRDAERAKHAAAAQGAVRRQRGHRRAVSGVDGSFSRRARKKPSPGPARRARAACRHCRAAAAAAREKAAQRPRRRSLARCKKASIWAGPSSRKIEQVA